MRTAPSFTVTVVFGGSLAAGSGVPYAQFQTANGASIICDHATAADSTGAYVYVNSLVADAELT